MSDPTRCAWAGADPLYRDYHDTEWGVPVRASRLLWETLMLEGFQAGLAWMQAVGIVNDHAARCFRRNRV